MAIDINIPSQVKTYATLASFPASGSLKTIYIAEDSNKTYRWTGSVYVEISATATSTWGSIAGTLSNQTDLQTALNAKEPTITAGTTSQYYRGDKTFQTLDKTAVGLSNVDNTSDANKPISTATQTALNGKVPTTRTLTINGTTQDLSADRTFTISTGITIGSTAITSGTVGRVLFEGTGNVVSESANLFWDNATSFFGVGTNTTTSNTRMVINESFTAQASTGLRVKGNGSSAAVWKGRIIAGGDTVAFLMGEYNSYAWLGGHNAALNAWAPLYINPDGGADLYLGKEQYSAVNAIMTLKNSTGNILINTNTDAGYKLDVNGTARVQGLTTIRTLASSYNSPLIVENTGSAAVDNKNVATFIGARGNSSNIDDNTNIGIWQKSNILSNYASVNFFNSLGNLAAYVGTQFVNHGASPIGNLIFGTSSGIPATRMTIFSTGNIGINTTTDAGYKLDVNGTARVSGQVNVTTNTIIKTDGTIQHNYLQTQYGACIGAFAYPAASVVLECRSTTQGFLPPRMTTTQKNAIATPATGLQVFDTTLNQMSYYNGTTWTNI